MTDERGEYEPSAWDWVADQVAIYERTDGAEANTLQGTDQPIIVVTMRGARSGKVRKIALMRVEHGGEYALVASKGGMPDNPGWYNNLKVHPDEVSIQDGAARFPVTVREVEGEERQLWWDRAVEAYADYETYKNNTDRHIPVLIASPA
jgi:deazaflavin-dependent oxidoreductase (nitroreductase family)